MGRRKGSKNRNSVDYMVNANMTDKVIGTKVDETFSITVTDDNDAELYKNEKETYSWQKVDSLSQVIESLGGSVSDEANAFIAEALPGDENGKAIKTIVELFNKNTRANAKNNRYQSVMNQYKPMSEDDAAKAFDRMVSLFAKINKVSEDVARKTLSTTKAAE